MKREITFRAWDDINKVMVYPHLTPSNFGSVSSWEILKNYDHVMQYTGLKDKHGKEIYEGDVCRILYTDWPSQSDYSISLDQHKTNISSIGIVEYNAPLWQLSIWDEKYKQYIPSCIEHGAHGEIEIIGNIYSDPSLLNQQ